MQTVDELEDMKPWQHGYPLAELKEQAAPFKAHFAPFVHGAFGVPKERDIAAALVAGRFHCRLAGGRVVASAIAYRLKTSGRHTDFTGRVVVIPAGEMYVSALCWLSGRKQFAEDLLRELRPAYNRIWWELHEEDAEAKALANTLGFEWVATKVSAGSTITGLYILGKTRRSGFLSDVMAFRHDPAELPGIRCCETKFIDVEQQNTILGEVAKLEKWWASHYSSYNKRGTWNAMALRGYDADDPQFIIKPAEMSRKWKAENSGRMAAKSAITALAVIAPETMWVVDSIPGEKDRIRFMRLAADGGELTRHADITDREAGVADGKVARLHIPLRSGVGCEFQSWDARGHHQYFRMHPCGLFYLDQRKPHACKNGSDSDRIHLVIDVYSSSAIRGMICSGTIRGNANANQP